MKAMSAPLFSYTLDFAHHSSVEGAWDFRNHFDSFIHGVDLAGMRVLDMRPRNGFFSFMAEERGAEVLGFDWKTSCPWPRLAMAPPPAPRDRVKAAYWHCHGLRDSRAVMAYGDVLPFDTPSVDMVLAFAPIAHQRDPIGYLSALTTQTRDYILILDYMRDRAGHFGLLVPEPGGERWIWTRQFYERVLDLHGFDCIAVHDFPSLRPLSPDWPFTRLLARRRG